MQLGKSHTSANAVTVNEIFSGDVLYRVPLFQRSYVWKKPQLDALWSDIDTVLEKSSSSRFLGALVVLQYQDRTATEPQAVWIIDGQQRLTTFYLLILACAYKADDLGYKNLARDYVRTHLLQQQSDKINEPKLMPSIPDLCQFREILKFIESYKPKLTGGEFGKSAGLLEDAFLTHLDEIDKRILIKGKASETLLKALLNDISTNIEFVQIHLAEHHDANEVFNRLNVSGERLETIDLIRNEVFSLLSNVTEADAIYQNHWSSFESSFDQGKLKEEIKKTVEIKNGYFFPFALIADSTTKKSEVFNKLSTKWKNQVKALKAENKAKQIIKNLKEYVPPYLALRVGTRPDNVANPVWEKVLKLHQMPAPVSLYPYFMRLLMGVIKNEVKERNAVECFKVIESFLVRRAFLGLEPTGLHVVFKDLWSKAGPDPEKVKSKVQTRTTEFPDDARFIEQVKTSDLYHRKLCPYILGEYERSFTKGDILKTFPPITADHLMPQSHKGEWKKSIADEEHTKWKDTWANLVPLSNKANAEKGAKSWKEVKKILGNETVFSTTKKLFDNYSNWGVKQLEERAKKLSEWAVKRWPK